MHIFWRAYYWYYFLEDIKFQVYTCSLGWYYPGTFEKSLSKNIGIKPYSIHWMCTAVIRPILTFGILVWSKESLEIVLTLYNWYNKVHLEAYIGYSSPSYVHQK